MQHENSASLNNAILNSETLNSARWKKVHHEIVQNKNGATLKATASKRGVE